jgi:hypothetical protein
MAKQIDLTAFDKAMAEHEEGSPSSDISNNSFLNDMGNDLSDLLVSGGQGATLGFGDELLAALESGESTLSGRTNVEDLYNTYRKLQKQHEGEYKELQKRSPVISTVGELGGGLALPLGILGKAKAGAGLLARLGQGAKTGALIGGVAGLGSSESDVEHPLELAEDVAKSTLGGAAIGTAASGIGETIGGAGRYLKDYVAESPKAQRAVTAYNLERAGTNLTTIPGQNKVVNDATKMVDTVVDALTAGPRAAKEQLNTELAKLTGHNLKSVLEPEQLEKIQSIINKNPYILENHPELVEKINSGHADIPELFQLKSDIVQSVHGNPNLKYEEKKHLLNFANTELENAIKTVLPDVEKLRQNIDVTAKPIENLINSTVDKLAQQTKMSELTKEQLRDRVKAGVYQQMKHLGGAGFQSVEQRTEFAKHVPDFEKMLNTIREQSIPMTPSSTGKVGTAEALAPYLENPNLMQQQVEEQAKNLGALRSTIGMQPNIDSETASKLLSGLSPVGIPEMGLTQVAGKVGRLVHKIAPAAEKVSNVGSRPAQAVDEVTKKMAQNLKTSNNKSMQSLGETLDKALQNKSSPAVGAAINSIMQSSSARKSLGIELGKSLDKQNINSEEEPY